MESVRWMGQHNSICINKKNRKEEEAATREEEIIVELWERNEASDVPPAAAASAVLVSIDAREATRAKAATWALVLRRPLFALFTNPIP